MKPYYQDDWVSIYHGDSRELIHAIQADIVLTDPPYANGTEYGSHADTPQGLDELIEGVVVPLIARSGTRVVLTPGNGNQALYPRPTWTLAWVVPAGAGRSSWGFTTWQPILVYGNDPYLAAGLGARADSVIWTETSEQNGHPCPKPIKFWRWLIQRVSVDASDVILDPFMGSGTTLRAAKDLNHKAIGIELEERFCEIAARRCAQEVLDLEAVA